MRRTVAALAFTAALASAAVSFTRPPEGMPPGKAEPTAADAVFLVPATDGYGVAECLTSGSECGQVVADAWCAAQGYSHAVAFGEAAREDMTGSLQKAVATAQRDKPVAVTCRK